MPEELLVRHCSPTLAGMKTGSLFNCAFSDADEMKSCVRCWNRTLAEKGLRVLPLRYRGSRALIYVYRPEGLSRDLEREEAGSILRRRGYCPDDPGRCVTELIRRLNEQEEFPHEIGLFLGYPPEDVRGFIENSAACKCVGYWKVYGDVEAAQKLFEKYRRCTQAYCALFERGKPIERLAVAI